MSPPLAAAPRCVLLVQLRHLGDVLLCTPAIRALRARFPNAEIDFLSGALGAEALAGNPHLDAIVVRRTGSRDLLRTLHRLRVRRYDVLVDLHGQHPRTFPFVLGSGARMRVGRKRHRARDWAYTHLRPRTETGPRYAAWEKLGMLRPLGVASDPGAVDLDLEIALGAAERHWAAEVWAKLGLAVDRPTIALSAVDRVAAKNWGAQRWAGVGDALAARGFQILLTHGPGERALAAAVAERMRLPPAWDYPPGQVRQLAALYERCVLWLGNDGGPKHVAVAAGVPTVTVFRAGKPALWAPPSGPHRFLEGSAPPGCTRRCSDCPTRGCLAAVSPEAVLATTLAALGAA